MSGIQMATLMIGQNLGALSGTMTASGSGSNVVGFNNTIPFGTVSKRDFGNGMLISVLEDNTFTNQLILAILDPESLLVKGSFAQLVMNALTFTSAASTFFASGGGTGSAQWQWSNLGVPVTGTGRTYVFT